MKMSPELFNRLLIAVREQREREVADRKDGSRKRHAMMAEYRDAGKEPREFRADYLQLVTQRHPDIQQSIADEDLNEGHVDTAMRRCFRKIYDNATWAGQE